MASLPRRAGRDRLGQGLTALCGGALALNLTLVAALLALLAVNGMGHFWPRPLVRFERSDGPPVLGQVLDRETIPPAGDAVDAPLRTRIRVRIGNRDLTGTGFVWLDEDHLTSRTEPAQAVLLERLEWGPFHGTLVELRRGGEVLASGAEPTWRAFQPLHRQKLVERKRLLQFERSVLGRVERELETERLARRAVELRQELAADERARRLAPIAARLAAAQHEFDALAEDAAARHAALLRESLVVEAADGTRIELPVANVVRAVRPNTLALPGKLRLYAARLWEFVAAEPRESNTEGGIFPAVFGTVTMVFLMSFAVTPFGVLAALYLREYARQGPLVRLVRIAVNNLAGVPSIVFGVFGLGFFVYLVGGTIDRWWFPEALPTPTFGTGGVLWASLTLALLTVPVVIVATEEGLAAVPRVVREGSLALGATKFETTWRVVLPAAAPGILTGLILAMARAAGEVAPLMIVGMVKLAPALPVDAQFPFVHLERKFMHLGFHIYDVGFQSPNVEATKPLVFATALLLVAIVTLINLVAIVARNRLRARFASSAV